MIECLGTIEDRCPVHRHLRPEPAVAAVRPVDYAAPANPYDVRKAVPGHVREVEALLGVAEPVGLYIDTHGTGTIDENRLTSIVRKNFSLTPKGIIDTLQTRAELSAGTLQLVKELLRDYLDKGPTQKELDDAKRELAGSFPLSNASNAAIAGQLGSIGFYDLPLDHLETFMAEVKALSVEQVKAALRRHLDPEALVIVSAGPDVAQQELPPPTDTPAAQPTGVPEH